MATIDLPAMIGSENILFMQVVVIVTETMSTVMISTLLNFHFFFFNSIAKSSLVFQDT